MASWVYRLKEQWRRLTKWMAQRSTYIIEPQIPKQQQQQQQRHRNMDPSNTYPCVVLDNLLQGWYRLFKNEVNFPQSKTQGESGPRESFVFAESKRPLRREMEWRRLGGGLGPSFLDWNTVFRVDSENEGSLRSMYEEWDKTIRGELNSQSTEGNKRSLKSTRNSFLANNIIVKLKFHKWHPCKSPINKTIQLKSGTTKQVNALISDNKPTQPYKFLHPLLF